MNQKELLEEYLAQLKLPTFVQNYEQYAQDASRGDSTPEQYLLALCEAEIAQRKVNRIERAIATAKFPIIKDLSTFDFHQVGGSTVDQKHMEMSFDSIICVFSSP